MNIEDVPNDMSFAYFDMKIIMHIILFFVEI